MKPQALLLSSVLALPLLCTELSCQEPSAPQGQPKAAPLPPVVVTLSFQGGTMADFIGQIRGKEPRVNIIVAEAAKNARLPAIELRGAGLDAALDAASSVAEGDVEIRVKDFRSAGEPVYSILAVPRNRGVVALSGSATGMQSQANTSTQVWSLNELTADAPQIGFQAPVILSAIEAAVAAGGTTIDVRYHKESGLLILRGGVEQLSVANEVVNNMRHDVQRRRSEQQGKLPAQPAEKVPERGR